MDKITSIRVKESTKTELDKIGKRGETYEQILLKLIKRHNRWFTE